MRTLHLLGGLWLEDDTAEPAGRGAQRLRLALLAILSLAPGRRLTRERITALLWPEASSAEGRGRLSSALYDARRLLGEGAITGSGDELHLQPAALATDVDQFQAAIARGDWQDAAARYTGPLLDGVHVGDSGEFEEWLSEHRARLRLAHLGVVEQLARRAMLGADLAEAEARWLQLVELEPLSGQRTLELMRVRVSRNDRAGALRAGEALTDRLAAELGVAPDPPVSEFMAELRRGHPLASGARVGDPDPMPTSAAPGRPSVDRRRPAAAGVVGPEARHRPRPVARRLLVPGGIGLLGLVAVLVARDPSASGATEAMPTRVAVLPFGVEGDSTLQYLRDGMVDLLSTALDGVGPYAVVDPHAILAATAGPPGRALAGRLGATRYVEGRVAGAGDTVRIRAVLRDAASGAQLHAVDVAGAAGTVTSLVDRVASQLVVAEFRGGATRIASVAAQTTLSLPALRAFLAGEGAFRRGRFQDAIEAYRWAVTLDTTFALAHYRLSLAILWGNAPGATTEFHDSLAAAHAQRLSARDRDLVLSYMAWRSGRAQEALDLYRALTRRHPDDVEGWFQLGETEFHYGPQLGEAIANARISFERVLALDPDHRGARWHLALLDGHQGRPARLRETVAHLAAGQPDPASVAEMLLTAGPSPGGGRSIDPSTVGDQEVYGAAWRRAVYLRDWGGAAGLLDELDSPSRSPYAQLLGKGGLTVLALAEGRWQNGHALALAQRTVGSLELTTLAAIIPGFERPPADRTRLRQTLHDWVAAMGGLLDGAPEARAQAMRLQALLEATTGDQATARQLATTLHGITTPTELAPLAHAWAQGILAYLALLADRPTEVLEALDRDPPRVWYGLAVTASSKGWAFERYLRAEALHRLGRSEEALRWYRTVDEHALGDLLFTVPALLRSAELQDRLGRPATALEQRGRAVELWRHADPENQELLRRYLAGG